MRGDGWRGWGARLHSSDLLIAGFFGVYFDPNGSVHTVSVELTGFVDTQEEAYMGVMERRKRRAFTKEFKAETVHLVVA